MDDAPYHRGQPQRAVAPPEAGTHCMPIEAQSKQTRRPSTQSVIVVPVHTSTSAS
jgi:hypothetical protein